MQISQKRPDLTEAEISIVFIGDFNPMIFHPTWLAHQELIRVNDASDAVINVIHTDVSQFQLDWVAFQILRDRFTATIKADAYKAHLGDIVQGIFTILGHTPVKQLGINVTVKAQFKSTEDWHSFGHFLTPKSPWQNVLEAPGMRSVNIQGKRVDERLGFTIFSIEPDLVTAENFANIRVNDHYDNPNLNAQTPINANWAVEILHENYNNSIINASKMINNLIHNFMSISDVDSPIISKIPKEENHNLGMTHDAKKSENS